MITAELPLEMAVETAVVTVVETAKAMAVKPAGEMVMQEEMAVGITVGVPAEHVGEAAVQLTRIMVGEMAEEIVIEMEVETAEAARVTVVTWETARAATKMAVTSKTARTTAVMAVAVMVVGL